MAESSKRHEENSNIIKEIQASTDAAIRNQRASIKTLEIQIGHMSKVLQETRFGRGKELKILETWFNGTTLHDNPCLPKDKAHGIAGNVLCDYRYVVPTSKDNFIVSAGRPNMVPTGRTIVSPASNWLERLPAGSITTWEDLTTRFLAQFFPPGRTAKLRNDILMFQQHHGESLSEAWTRFKDLLQKVPHHGIDRWLQIQIFYDHVSFHLKCEIDRAAGGKLRDKNADESWEIIENLALYDHEGWNDTKEFVKPVKAISTPQSTSKTPDRRLLELEDQINFLLKGSRPTPRPSSTHIPQAYAEAVYSNPRPQNQNEPPKQNPFTFRERTGPNPQPQALGTTFEARVRDYMAAHTERMERFENAIFKQREEINDRMTEMFGPEKVLIREEAKFPVTKNTETKMPVKEAEKEDEAENEPNRKAGKEETTEAPSSQPVEYYLKHRINEKLIEVLVGSDVNVMPLSTYTKLTDERPAETDIRLSLASHSYIYPLGIAEDILVEVAEHVYPVDFVILDIKEDEKRPFILGTPFLTTAKAVIKFDKGTITLRSGKSKISFHRIPESLCKIERGVKNDIDPIAPTMTVNRLVLE
ncbi:zinc finger, CCHC-type containing protein [Tanacetum coccineum]